MSNGAPELKYFSFGTAGKKVLSRYDFEHDTKIYLLDSMLSNIIFYNTDQLLL